MKREDAPEAPSEAAETTASQALHEPAGADSNLGVVLPASVFDGTLSAVGIR
jgi:hypothetical protein